MAVFIEARDRRIALDLAPGESPEMLRERVAALFGLDLCLTAAGRPLVVLEPGMEISGFAPLDGAGKDKKRKKKQHKTPKTIKHVHKKVKLACLKYYSVKGDDVQSLREYCSRCGAGVRMAQHKDRVHCGRCGNSKKF